ncbi:MAG TPA: bacillithiol biosynthesis cysteine-adding enzyme BshC [Panacibacter sp.]|nr:bacillithiol biosynthesis cysteine-adding enzyme BshC [Panacibacter sp.]HNP46770.1 bacillithiol biosynthesis cysteine-adding enzyme BshC [Panacibacter sp.]
MEVNATTIAYEQTGYFSKLATDYLNGSEALRPFYQHPVSIDGIKASIEARKQFAQQRGILTTELKQQYSTLQLHQNLATNLALLNNDNCFTITTAHQPNIFTGPLYFLYKILHAIKLAENLKKQLPEYDFVPVYYMGSEDADLDEIGTFTSDGVKYQWKTKQTGAVGRMKVDKEFLQIIAYLRGQLGVRPFGNDIIDLFSRIYTTGKTIQEATLELVNELFGAYGLVVVIPDNASLKKLFHSVVEKELTEGFSHTAVSETIIALEKHYKVQAGGRALNLFYLVDDKRERIELINGIYEVKALGLRFSTQEILKELETYPERFSANVILRGAFQETILPGIAFIGGGGELAYWLELKKVFEAANIPYPVLLLRNSFLIAEAAHQQKLESIGLSMHELFLPIHELMNLVVARNGNGRYQLNGQLAGVQELYDRIAELATQTDNSLTAHVASLKAKAVKRLQELEKKMLRAGKRKFEAEQRQLQKIKSVLFPGDSLQERVENLSAFYAKYGGALIELLYTHSLSLEQQFVLLTVSQ